MALRGIPVERATRGIGHDVECGLDVLQCRPVEPLLLAGPAKQLARRKFAVVDVRHRHDCSPVGKVRFDAAHDFGVAALAKQPIEHVLLLERRWKPVGQVALSGGEFVHGDALGRHEAAAFGGGSQEKFAVDRRADVVRIPPGPDLPDHVAAMRKRRRREELPLRNGRVVEHAGDRVILRSGRRMKYGSAHRKVGIGSSNGLGQPCEMIRRPDVVVTQIRDVGAGRAADSGVVRIGLAAVIAIEVLPAHRIGEIGLQYRAGRVAATVADDEDLERAVALGKRRTNRGKNPFARVIRGHDDRKARSVRRVFCCGSSGFHGPIAILPSRQLVGETAEW